MDIILYDDPESNNTCVSCLAIVALMHNGEFAVAITSALLTDE